MSNGEKWNFLSATNDKLLFFVNGKKVEDPNPDPEISLLTYLRRKLRLVGTKLGCGEGGCGACTVMVSRWDSEENKAVHLSVNACLAPVVSMHGCAVTTVEGIGSTKTKLHAVQERLAKNHGSQCGFCTPGIVMSMYTLLRNNPIPTTEDIEMGLQGNLCRCTGYRPIIKAFNTFTQNNKSVCCKQGENCCQNQKITNGKINEDLSQANEEITDTVYKRYDPTQEPIFPPELQIMSKTGAFNEPLKFIGERITWYKPTSLDQLTEIKQRFPDAHLVVGNTEIGIETWVKGRCFPVIATPAHVKELTKIEVDDGGVVIGSSCTLTQIRKEIIEIIERIGFESTQPLSAILEMLYWFAGDQIRNVGVLGGNIMTASPISDLNPIFMTAETVATFNMHSRGERNVIMDQSFFPSYRKTSAQSEEVLMRVKIPFTGRDEYMKAYMQSRRREDDIAIVNTAMRVRFYPGTHTVSKFVAAFGGMAATTVMPHGTMKKMIGRYWDEKLLEDVFKWLREDLPLKANAPGGMVEYRETLAASFFFKFFLYVKDCLTKQKIIKNNSSCDDQSAMMSLREERRPLVDTQTWQEVPSDQSVDDMVGRPLLHLSAEKQTTGEAVYVDDMPLFADELYLALVTSTRAHAKILNIDVEAAQTSPGFVAWVDYRDVPGENDLGPWGEAFGETEVTCVGHVIGAVVADNHEHAQRAARLVKIVYEDLHPAIITIEDAIKHNSFYNSPYRIVSGDAEGVLKDCDHVVDGEFRIGGQEHFYLETQVCLVVPKGEDEEFEIYASSQNPTELQMEAAQVLGVDSNKIVVRMKRMGGGFGGKETRFNILTNPAIVAAHKCKKPIRCMLSRSEDMLITGGRHPFLGKYKVGFTSSGKILSVICDLYSNGGNSIDLSLAVMDKALLKSDQCYKIPNISYRGYVCKTNVASNTAFRGFGGPQGMMITEDVISTVAGTLKKMPEEIRFINLYKDGDLSYYGEPLINYESERCWQDCMRKSEFEKAKQEIESFNNKNRWRKRGISCVPTQFGVAFGFKSLNQGGALVHVYKDGSVLVTHGGTEMGQGLHTKMAQIAGRCFAIPISSVFISETSTNTVPNTSPTAASLGSDINGMAVKKACDEIMERLKPLQKANPTMTWQEVVMKAYLDRISLSATGFYKIPGLDFVWDKETGKVSGNPSIYTTCGAAVSQVEVDCLTGDHITLKTDIVMDVGKSINPAIDIGQIEGAFLQGYGLFTLEESLHTPSGHLLARGPGAYKIPGFGDCPRQFNVHLLRNSENDKAIFLSKAIGEPPFFLASSVFFAIKDAIGYARNESGLFGRFCLNSPATAERIRMACGDKLTLQNALHKSEDEKELQPWAIQS